MRELAMVLAKGSGDSAKRSFCHEVISDNTHMKAQKSN